MRKNPSGLLVSQLSSAEDVQLAIVKQGTGKEDKLSRGSQRAASDAENHSARPT
jgi:hypothetical protein